MSWEQKYNTQKKRNNNIYSNAEKDRETEKEIERVSEWVSKMEVVRI